MRGLVGADVALAKATVPAKTIDCRVKPGNDAGGVAGAPANCEDYAAAFRCAASPSNRPRPSVEPMIGST